jgi:hypothetical protein
MPETSDPPYRLANRVEEIERRADLGHVDIAFL